MLMEIARKEYQVNLVLITNSINNHTYLIYLKVTYSALAGVSQWIECQPAQQRVNSSVPSQSTCLGCGPGPQCGAYKRHPNIDVSLPLFLPPFPLSKNK